MRFLKRKAQPETLPLCYYGDTVLRDVAAEIPQITPEIVELGETMCKTMHEEDGIGLAGPQVGQLLRIITVDIPRQDAGATPGELFLSQLYPLVLVNPVLSDFSEERNVRDEGCLSIPEVTGPVERPVYVQLTAQLLNGQAISYRCGGLLARCLQHEVDHLDGKLFVDYLGDEDRERIQARLAEIQEAAARNERPAPLRRSRRRG